VCSSSSGRLGVIIIIRVIIRIIIRIFIRIITLILCFSKSVGGRDWQRGEAKSVSKETFRRGRGPSERRVKTSAEGSTVSLYFT
jgi:hypothetical protein